MSPAAPADRPAAKGFPADRGQLLGRARVPAGKRNGKGQEQAHRGTPCMQRRGAGSCLCCCGQRHRTSSSTASVPAGAPGLPAGLRPQLGAPAPAPRECRGKFPRRPPHSPSPRRGLAPPEFPGGRGAGARPPPPAPAPPPDRPRPPRASSRTGVARALEAAYLGFPAAADSYLFYFCLRLRCREAAGRGRPCLTSRCRLSPSLARSHPA